MANSNLTNAKRTKNDEFYTQYPDIQKEVGAYLEYNPDVFRGKVVYCNCDDPYESNFFQYFANEFNNLGLKELITTSYEGSPVAFTQTAIPGLGDDKPVVPKKGRAKKAIAYKINEVSDFDYNGAINSYDVKHLVEHDNNATKILRGDGQYPAGDFRSKDCVDLLKQADIVVTNPPFSLFREYIDQLVNNKKDFLIIGSMNALKYANVFPLIRANKIWLGVSSGSKTYLKPDKTEQKMGNTCWFTNLDHGRRHQPLRLQTMADNLKFSKHKEIRGKKSYDKYDNYDAIEVPFTDVIPEDYGGIMGVPISFLDKYNPEQFEIIGLGQGNLYRELTPKGLSKEFVTNYYLNGGTGSISENHPILGYYDENGKARIPFMRILIKHREQKI